MAGDWIPAEVNMPRKPKVLRIARITGRKRAEVAGLLLEFWGWASHQTIDGILPNLALSDLVHAIQDTDEPFWLALVEVGWLEIHADRLVIPRIDEWISKGAKSRLLKNARQARWRDDVDAPVDGGASTAAPTTEENRREELGEVSPKTPLVRDDEQAQSSRTDGTLFRSAEDQATKQNHQQAVAAAAALLDNNDPVVLTFPVTKPKSRKSAGQSSTVWHLRRSKLAEYTETFPGIDVLAECRKALQWCRDNPRNIKTPGGMTRFLNLWLSRAQNQAHPTARSAPASSGADRSQGKDSVDSRIRQLRGEEPKQEGAS